ncbi:hypothetical protein Lfu02_41980 [Longispora fulva]|nr:hypothetical protein Lfu02_41980 [Longispora fulva]
MAVSVALGVLVPGVAQAAPTPTPSAKPQNKDWLPKDWKKSADLAWTTTSDASGLHILTAPAREGYAWRTVASLAEPGFDADHWVGNACLTGSAQRLVVTYAPRTFTNRRDLFDRGGFTAVVDLTTGQVRKLPVQSSLAYFSPGCGAGESAVVTQLGSGRGAEDRPQVRLIEIDAVTGQLGTPIVVTGEVTSAVPTRDGIVAAGANRLVKVGRDGKLTGLAAAHSTPFNVHADADGGVVFMDREGDRARVLRSEAKPGAGARTVAEGKLAAFGTQQGAGGRLFLTGKADKVYALPKSVTAVSAPTGSVVSSHGQLAVSLRNTPRTTTGDPAAPQRVELDAKALGTGKATTFQVTPDAPGASGGAPHPKLGTAAAPRGLAALGSPTDPVEAERYCAVPRNDPRNMAMQPKPRQVEWAVDQAITGTPYADRPANWKNLGMPAYSPLTLFPPIDLIGGGRVPSQVMLGVIAQESNMWQASRVAIPGQTATPLIGNFYGRDIYNGTAADDWDIKWADADCGYGVTQMTDGMRLAGHEKEHETALPYQTQRAVALDFAANIAAGARVLQGKWNQTRNNGMTVNDGNPGGIENWYYALWAYNSGFHMDNGDGSPWGVGWGNNPVNPRFKPDRTAFLDQTYADAAHPQDWPYQEKVLGFAGHPPELLDGPDHTVSGFRPAWWSSSDDRTAVKPAITQFCDATDQCVPGAHNLPGCDGSGTCNGDSEVYGEPAGACAHRDASGYFDLKCWYHASTRWKADSAVGNEILRFDPGWEYQPDATSYPPRCDNSGLPAGALVIDDVPAGTPSTRPDCGPMGSNGTFGLRFSSDSAGLYPSKVDFHQLGGGYGGHFWFGHTRTINDEAGKLETTGTWTLDRPLTQWARVLVHLPDTGAHTQQARYEIDLGDNTFSKFRYLSQNTQENRWMSLGVYQFAGTPKIRLSTVTQDGRGVEDIAWDAVAVQPLAGKPEHFVVAMGDSYSSGEGAGNYYRETDANHGTPEWNACRRSRDAWSRKMVLPGANTTPVGTRADAFDPSLEFAFVACSGAWAYDLTTHNPLPAYWTQSPEHYELGDGQYREMPQIDSGVLDGNTTLVTISIGGNDAGFTKAFEECSYPSNCTKDSTFMSRHKADIDATLADNSYVSAQLRKISEKAPHAQIVFVGYPAPISPWVKCAGGGYIDLSEASAMGELADYMETQQLALVSRLNQAGVRIAHASPKNAFADHAACDPTPWINAITPGPNGEGDFHGGDRPSRVCLFDTDICASRESFHPNAAGTTAYANVVRGRLLTIPYPQP